MKLPLLMLSFLLLSRAFAYQETEKKHEPALGGSTDARSHLREPDDQSLLAQTSSNDSRTIGYDASQSPASAVDSVQERTTGKGAQQKRQRQGAGARKEMEGRDQMLKGFIDEDGDGIDDRLQGKRGEGHGQMRIMMQDRFIDLDGDGINDDRCTGMGIGRAKASKPRGMHR